MRYTRYCCRDVHTNEVFLFMFKPEHFNYMGISYSSLGMPQIEAHELIHEWNREPSSYVYYLTKESQ